MFCPKCGTKNPEDGKFCRKCGTDLAPITEALAGGSSYYTSKKKRRRKRKYSWESAMGKLFMGAAFLAVSMILGVTGAAGGHAWWYWMLIPAFSMLGTGTAEILQITYGNRYVDGASDGPTQIAGSNEKALPPQQTEFVAPDAAIKYDTGDLVPPSVVENTTRLLEVDKDSKTINLPERD